MQFYLFDNFILFCANFISIRSFAFPSMLPNRALLVLLRMLNSKLLDHCRDKGWSACISPVWTLCVNTFFKDICIIVQNSVLLCCLDSVFSVCTDYLSNSQKSMCTEITIFFHFFRSIASCDHQSTSEGQLVRPFSLLLTILLFS